MHKNKMPDNSKSLVACAVKAMQDKKAKNVISLDLTGIQDSISDYFVICHGTSTPQVDAIYDNVVEKVLEKCKTKLFTGKEQKIRNGFD